MVLNHRTIDFLALIGAALEQMSGSTAKIVARLTAKGANHLSVDGVTIQEFLRAGMVVRSIITLNADIPFNHYKPWKH